MQLKRFEYLLTDDTLIVKGKFFGVSTGINGGIRRVNYVFNHTVKNYIEDEEKYLRSVAKKYGLKKYFGMLTAVNIDDYAFSNDGEVTVFATAGLKNPNEKIGTVNIIAVLDCKVKSSTLLNSIITITEAKSSALLSLGYNFTGTTSDAVVVVATQRGNLHRYAGYATELGRHIWVATKKSVMESVKKWQEGI
ncbi:MAG: adenosylcobinamide amidohydrolase [Archaeoglobales archaeon]|nr:adenosylcobinamide amidohydrolase [Archaeoglobales archaeon]